MKIASFIILFFLSLSLVRASNGEDCVDCGNTLTGTDDGKLILEYMSGSELIENVVCSDSKDFTRSFCTLLTVFDKMEDYYKYVKRCHSGLSLDELYGRAAFACSKVGYHQSEMSLLSHLAIQFPEFSVGIMPVVRAYRDQGRLKRFSELLNEKDSQGRTFLDTYKEAKDKGEYIGTLLPAATRGIVKKACMLGGEYNKYPQPKNCKRKDKLFTY